MEPVEFDLTDYDTGCSITVEVTENSNVFVTFKNGDTLLLELMLREDQMDEIGHQYNSYKD